MSARVTYLIGSRYAANAYLRSQGLPPDNKHVRVVQDPDQLHYRMTWDQAVFLSDWQTLPLWRELYNAVIARKGETL